MKLGASLIARMLGISPARVIAAVKRGELEGKKADYGWWLVEVNRGYKDHPAFGSLVDEKEGNAIAEDLHVVWMDAWREEGRSKVKSAKRWFATHRGLTEESRMVVADFMRSTNVISLYHSDDKWIYP